jgi:signal recognition particle subunit SEC65
MSQADLIYRLRKRAEIRRQIPTRRSVQENQPDRIADLLEEAALEIQRLRDSMFSQEESQSLTYYLNEYLEQERGFIDNSDCVSPAFYVQAHADLQSKREEIQQLVEKLTVSKNQN